MPPHPHPRPPCAAYDFGDTAGLTPLMKMHTLGAEFIPDSIHAGGLRYHGMSPLISHIYELGLMEAISIDQNECFNAATLFANTEGIVPAPEVGGWGWAGLAAAGRGRGLVLQLGTQRGCTSPGGGVD